MKNNGTLLTFESLEEMIQYINSANCAGLGCRDFNPHDTHAVQTTNYGWLMVIRCNPYVVAFVAE